MKLRPFELALVVFFAVLMVLSLVLLRTYSPEPDEDVVTFGGVVSIWGFLPQEVVSRKLEELAVGNPNFGQVYYSYVDPAEFDDRFINALADGNGPDLLLISHEYLVKHRNRLESFPYETFPVPDIRSTYIDGAEIFALRDGMYGYPVAVDPLMMYWNRDMLSEQNILVAPATWESVVADVVPKLTVRDFNRTIEQSGLAMGEYRNIRNAFPIISTLLLQGGSALVTEETVGRYAMRLDETLSGQQGRPLTNAFTFYTNFSTIANTLYSWNRSLPTDRDMFLREDLALYFGFGSEARDLAARNPNLNFDIAPVPQGAASTVSRTYGKFYAFLVPRAANNKSGAYQVMQTMSQPDVVKSLADNSGLVSVYRATVIAGSNDVYGRVIYGAVPSARGWLSPDKTQVDTIFSAMLEDVSANRSTVPAAMGDVIGRLERAY